MSWVRFNCAVLFLAALSVSKMATGWTHIARKGETIESLAVRYYGSASMTMVIRAANGFVHPDDGRLTRGERIDIPEATVHKCRRNDTWESLAEMYLGSKSRGSFLSGMNEFTDEKAPPIGTLIKIPYHLRHIFASRETIKSVTRMYLGAKVSVRWVKAYNFTRKKRFRRGDVLIIPLIALELVPEERKKIDEEMARRATNSEAESQMKALADLGEIRTAYNRGHYVKAVVIAGRAIGRGGLSVPQEIGIHNYLAFTYVALGEEELAVEAFRRAIELQPGMVLSPITTSPKILAAFNRAKTSSAPSSEINEENNPKKPAPQKNP